MWTKHSLVTVEWTYLSNFDCHCWRNAAKTPNLSCQWSCLLVVLGSLVIQCQKPHPDFDQISTASNSLICCFNKCHNCLLQSFQLSLKFTAFWQMNSMSQGKMTAGGKLQKAGVGKICVKNTRCQLSILSNIKYLAGTNFGHHPSQMSVWNNDTTSPAWMFTKF